MNSLNNHSSAANQRQARAGLLKRVSGEIGRTLHYGPELNSNEAIKALVASNIGISILSEHAVRPELQIGRLVAVRIHGLTLVRSLSLISCAESKLSPAARAMRAVFIAETTAGRLAV